MVQEMVHAPSKLLCSKTMLENDGKPVAISASMQNVQGVFPFDSWSEKNISVYILQLLNVLKQFLYSSYNLDPELQLGLISATLGLFKVLAPANFGIF